MNFSLEGVWSVGAKGSWVDLSPIELEIVGYWHATRRLHYHKRGHIRLCGPQTVRGIIHEERNVGLSPRMFKLTQELMKYPFVIWYMPGRGALIGMVDALSRAPHEDASTLCADPLDLQYHSVNRDQGQTSHESCFANRALGLDTPCPYRPTLQSTWR